MSEQTPPGVPTERPQKRFWLRLVRADLFLESAPTARFDAWAESALMRETAAVATSRFGNQPLVQVPMVRYERYCVDPVTNWLLGLAASGDVQRKKLALNQAVPPKFPLSLFLASQYENLLDVVPTLILQWPRLVRPALIILDGRSVAPTQVSQQARAAHRLLCGLADRLEQTACYGPVAVATFPKLEEMKA